jgi:hypothetical protein
MLLFSINKSRGYENPRLDIIVTELYSIGGFPLKEAHEHCFQIQSAISVVILISFQCYCGECSSYIVVILLLLTFYLCSAYIFYLVYYTVARQPNIEPGLQDQTNIDLNLFNTILDTSNTRFKLNRSWETIEQDISPQERWEARRRQPRNRP